MKYLAELKRSIKVGTRIEVLFHWQDAAHPDRPPLAGTVRTVEKVQRNGYFYRRADGKRCFGDYLPAKCFAFFPDQPDVFEVRFEGKGTARFRLLGGAQPLPMPSAGRVTIQGRRKRPATHALAGDLLIRPEADGGQALVAKYRPRCLREVLGQADVVDSLRTFAGSPYPCAMLFHGDSGTGKTSAAYALAHEIGVAVEETELGGLYEVASGSQSTDAVRRALELLRYRPLAGSGWRVLIVNECDRMALPCETVWLDGLEHLPPQTVVVFTTNDPSRLSARFRGRCEEFAFRSETAALAPWIAALSRRVWEQEVGAGEPPTLDTLGLPTLGAGEEASFNASFRLALQQLQKMVRAAKAGR